MALNSAEPAKTRPETLGCERKVGKLELVVVRRVSSSTSSFSRRRRSEVGGWDLRVGQVGGWDLGVGTPMLFSFFCFDWPCLVFVFMCG